VHVVKEGACYALTAPRGVRHDVLNVDLGGVVLASEGEDNANQIGAVESDWARRRKQVGVQPVVGGRAQIDIWFAEGKKAF
jgi:hypothetical protein